jgi:enoyl-CoA hydratase
MTEKGHPMDYETLLVTRQDRVGLIGLNRPAIRNAINTVMLAELTRALAALNADSEIRVVILHGHGPAFCSGFDMKQSLERKTEGIGPWRTRYEENFAAMIQFWDSPKPTISALHGYCIAGGFELALACDMSIAGEDTVFGMPEAKFGSASVCLMLPWIVGPRVAKEILLSGMERLDAKRAGEIGLVNRVVPAGTHLDAALALAQEIAACAPGAVRLLKRSINRSMDAMGMRNALLAALETGGMIEAEGGPERAEFSRIRREEGLKAAIAWRNAQGRVG